MQEMTRLPLPKSLELPLSKLTLDLDLNPRDRDAYRTDDMRDMLESSGALNDTIKVHYDAITGVYLVMCGHRQVTTLGEMFESAEDKKAWSKQWEPIACQVYENLTKEQILFVVNDHGGRLPLNKVGIWNAFVQAQQNMVSVSSYVDRNWQEIAGCFKNPGSKLEAERRIDKETTDVGRRKVRCATVKQHTDIMRFVYRVKANGVSNLEHAYLQICKGKASEAPILFDKKAWSDLANKSDDDIDAGRKPCAKHSSYRSYWDELVAEKKEKDAKKESDEPDPNRGTKQATKAEIAAAKRQCKTQFGRDCMDFAAGDKTMLSRILENEKSTLSLADIPAMLEPVWKEIRKITDGFKAGSAIVTHLQAALAEQRLAEESKEEESE